MNDSLFADGFHDYFEKDSKSFPPSCYVYNTYLYIYSIGIVHHKSLAITFFFRREKVRKEEKEKKKREVGLKTLG